MIEDSDAVEQKLIDIVCTKRFDEMNKIKDAYKHMYHRDLTQDIEMKTSEHIGSILLSMVNANRNIKVDIKLSQS